jgi:hypothetical protein
MISELESIPIKTIIREAVHTYAKEPYHNIIINDLENHGLKLLEYRGDSPLYFFFNDTICKNMTFKSDVLCRPIYADGSLGAEIPIKNLPDTHINNLVNGFNEQTGKI